MHNNIIKELNNEYEIRLKEKEEDLKEKFQREKDNELNNEREKFESKIDIIRMQLKSEFERLLKVLDDSFNLLNFK